MGWYILFAHCPLLHNPSYLGSPCAGAGEWCLPQIRELWFFCVSIRRNLGALISAVIFKGDILALPVVLTLLTAEGGFRRESCSVSSVTVKESWWWSVSTAWWNPEKFSGDCCWHMVFVGGCFCGWVGWLVLNLPVNVTPLWKESQARLKCQAWLMATWIVLVLRHSSSGVGRLLSPSSEAGEEGRSSRAWLCRGSSRPRSRSKGLCH